MTRSVLLTVALYSAGFGCTSSNEPPAPTVAQPGLLSALRRAIELRTTTAGWTNPWDGTLERVEIRRFRHDHDLYVALFDWQADWWGDFVVFCAANGELRWTASLASEEAPGAAYGVAARGFRVEGFVEPLVEVFWSSHMGNGNLYLYELRDRHLHLVLETPAVGHRDRWLCRGGRLRTSYEDVNGDGFADLTLSGILDKVLDPEGWPLDARPGVSKPIRETFLRNPASRLFERRDR